jgi:hypothetical protein
MKSLELAVNFVDSKYSTFDRKNRFYVLIDCILECFRVIMACGLVIFVPQLCYGPTGCEKNDPSTTRTTCSIYANVNFTCLSYFNLFVLSFNIFTALSFLFLYVIEIKRDQWIMKHFKKDEDENDNFIKRFYLPYEGLFLKLRNYNQLYNIAYKVVTFIYITNSILSAILFYFHFFDITTVTTLLTNFLLSSRKIYLGLFLSYNCVSNNSPTCYFERKFISYNSIDIGVRNIAKYCSNLNDESNVRRNSLEIGPFVGVKQIIQASKHVMPHRRSSRSNTNKKILEKYNLNPQSDRSQISDDIENNQLSLFASESKSDAESVRKSIF